MTRTKASSMNVNEALRHLYAFAAQQRRGLGRPCGPGREAPVPVLKRRSRSWTRSLFVSSRTEKRLQGSDVLPCVDSPTVEVTSGLRYSDTALGASEPGF